MAAAKRAWCSGSNDFNVVAADSGSERPPCLPSDSRMAEAAKRRRLAEVFDELDDVSSDSCWSSTSESSSSSSDDDDEVYAAAFQQLFSLPERRPKVEAYVTKTFKRNFRVTRPVVDFLAAEFAKSPHCPQNSDHGGLPAKSAEEHILSFLWYAANKACIRDVAGRFEVAESTHHRMMGRVTAFLLDIAPNVIKFPSDLQKLAVDFEKLSGFPDTIGCVDGSYMPIRELKLKLAERRQRRAWLWRRALENLRIGAGEGAGGIVVQTSGEGHAWDLCNYLQSSVLVTAGRNNKTCWRK
ncbi:hypothetical protein HPB51_009331 [Rhipicephalus microplus]|uniref:Uncharacterized protein n=1 Tax=Rhipicephalus microplus TaxID=6941 RepID=A0A9J6F092_RHIMP|nr:hypothetical protein HPB51_009331 [Rhipicephalus microplus]